MADTSVNPTACAGASLSMSSYYMARQPILDVAGQTYGYELLFRSSDSNAYDPSVDGDTATSNVLFNAIVEAGLESLVGQGLAFINLTNRFLERTELLELLPTGRCVLEVLETVNVTDQLVDGVRTLHEQGHLLALDDFVDEDRFAQLLPMADIIKYDITQHSMDELARYRAIDKAAGRRSLAERVETQEEFQQLASLGFDYFQGYFFARPKIVSGAKLPQNRIALMQLMAEINDPDATAEDVAEIVGRDVSLGVRTLKYVNSPLSGLRAEVSSIRQATIMLGRSLIRNWVTLLVMSELDDMPAELIKMALLRARFCQLLADREAQDEARYFTLGLLSLLDVFMSRSMSEALEHVPLNSDMQAELLHRQGRGGRYLTWVEAMESDRGTRIVGQAPADVGSLYQAATQWADETSRLLA